MVTLQRAFAEIGDGVSCKAMDNRLAVYVMIEAMKRAKSFAFETYPVATVQEEVGLRGAMASALGWIQMWVWHWILRWPADMPGIPAHEQVTRLGKGTAIKIQDSSSISHPGLVSHMKALAEARNIEYQMEILPRGGTDAGGIQRVRAGVPVITLSIPTRYVHTSIELADKGDIEASIQLLAAFMEEGHSAPIWIGSKLKPARWRDRVMEINRPGDTTKSLVSRLFTAQTSKPKNLKPVQTGTLSPFQRVLLVTDGHGDAGVGGVYGRARGYCSLGPMGSPVAPRTIHGWKPVRANPRLTGGCC